MRLKRTIDIGGEIKDVGVRNRIKDERGDLEAIAGVRCS